MIVYNRLSAWPGKMELFKEHLTTIWMLYGVLILYFNNNGGHYKN